MKPKLHHRGEKSRSGDGRATPITPLGKFVMDIYAAVNDATSCELERLRKEEGLTASCRMGCYTCCKYNVRMNMAEAHTLGLYAKREMSQEQKDALRLRTRRWHLWDTARQGRLPSPNDPAPSSFSEEDSYCPLLIDGVCSAYPVRPMACRTHFVISNPLSCRISPDMKWTDGIPVLLPSIVSASESMAEKMKRHIEGLGVDFSRTIMLLPHYLAVEMNWDFALSG